MSINPNLTNPDTVNKYPADILESGLSRVRNMPPVEFSRPTQLPRQAYQPSGNFSLANPSIGGPSFAVPFDVRNLAPQLNPTPGGRANPFEVGNADITSKPTPDFRLLNRVLAQKPNSVGKAPINNLESGLARVRNLPPVEFSRPTQLPRQAYQPDVLESGLARVNNLPPVEFNRPTQLPRQGYSPDALAGASSKVRNMPPVEFNRPTQLPRQAYQPSGNFSLANPSIGGPSFAIPFDVRNLAPQLNPPPIYTANTQDTFNQTVRPHLVQGLNRLLQTGRVANRMRPNARNVIMDYVNNNQ